MSIIERSRIVFLGMGGEFSLPPLRALLAAGANVAAVVTPARQRDGRGLRPLPPPGPAGDRPALTSLVAADMAGLAWERAIPLFEVGSLRQGAAVAGLAGLRPGLICVACFPWLLPPAWLELPPLGCLNLHPSLLPAYRGPAPLFWQFRAGEGNTGVSLHFMEETADSGDLVAQAAVALPDGATAEAADRLLGAAGAALLVEALGQERLPRRPQPVTGASQQPWPGPAERVIPVSWTARRAYNFLCGAAGWGPFLIDTGREWLPVGRALGYEDAAVLEEPYVRVEGELWVQFSPGVLRAG